MNGGPGADVGRVPARRQPRPDAGAGRRPARRLVVGGRDLARGDPARPDRAHRDPARPGVEPLRRRRHRRRDPGVHASAAAGAHVDRQRERRLRHLRHVERQRGLRGSAGPARVRGRRRAARAARGFNAIVDPDNFSYNPDRDGYANAERRRQRRARRGRPGQEVDGAVLQQPPQQPVRRRAPASTIAPSPRSRPGRWRAATGSPIAGCRCSRSARAATTRSSQTGFGDYPVQDHAAPVHLAERLSRCRVGALSLALERREERLAHRRGLRGHRRATPTRCPASTSCATSAFALQANLRHDDSSQYGGKTTGGIAYGYRLSPAWRVTAGYSTGFKAPSFNDLYYPGFSNPDLVPETARNIEVGVVLDRRRAGDGAREARAVGYRNRVRELIVFQCDADFNCAPQNVDRATLEGVTLGLDATLAATRALHGSLDLQSPDRRSHRRPAAAARAAARRAAAAAAGGPGAGSASEFVASSLRYDDAANLVKMGGYGIVNLTAEWPFAARRDRCSCAATTCSTRTTSSRPTTRPAARRCSPACGGSRDARARAFALLLVACAGAAPRRGGGARRRRRGRHGDAAAPARRIVSLAPHATEMLFAAGAGARVVGVVAHSRLAARGARAAARRRRRARSTSSASSRCSPTWSSPGRTRRRRSSRALRARGIAVFVSDPHDDRRHRRRHRAAGRARGHRGARARRPPRRCASATAALDRAVSRARARSRVFYEVWNDAAVHDRRPATSSREAIARVRRRERVRRADAARADGRRRGGAGRGARGDRRRRRRRAAPGLARRLAALAGAAGGARRQPVRASTATCCTARARAFSTASPRCARSSTPRVRRSASARR